MADQPPVLPSWRYHVSGEARIIATQDDLTALVPGEWFESAEAAQAARAAPAEAEAPAAPPRRR